MNRKISLLIAGLVAVSFVFAQTKKSKVPPPQPPSIEKAMLPPAPPTPPIPTVAENPIAPPPPPEPPKLESPEVIAAPPAPPPPPPKKLRAKRKSVYNT